MVCLARCDVMGCGVASSGMAGDNGEGEAGGHISVETLGNKREDMLTSRVVYGGRSRGKDRDME